MHTFLLFFAWPLGAVWSNLIASALCAAWVTIHNRSVRKLQKTLHDELMDLHILHHQQHMKAIAQVFVTSGTSEGTIESGGDNG